MFNWLNFLTYAIITSVTPGPNNIMSLSNSSQYGFKRSLSFNLGILSGCSIIMCLSAIFSGIISSALPMIKMPMQILGAIYMIYLAWQTFQDSNEIKESRVELGFRSGFALQFVNPKIYLYALISMQVYVLPYFSGQVFHLFAFALLLAFIGFLATLCWLAFGSLFKILFSKYSRVTNTIMAILLVYCAVSLFL